jgi:NADH-quinone oxidoreductase subunit M
MNMRSMYIRTMHNRPGPRVSSRDLGVTDAMVLVPLVAVILFFAVYPQLALHRSEPAVVAAIAPARGLSTPGTASASAAVVRVPRRYVVVRGSDRGGTQVIRR